MRFLLCWFLSLAAVPVGAVPLPLDAVRTEFVRRVVASEASLNRVWPGFSLPKNGLLLHFKGTGSLLLAAEGARGGFRELDAADRRRLGAPAALKLAFKAGAPPPIATSFSIDHEVSGLRVFVLVYDDRMSVDDQVVFLHHEAFHKLQWDAFASGGAAPKTPTTDTPELAALRRIENRLLLLALNDPESWVERARDFIAVRRRRHSLSDASQAPAEDAVERREGVAEYAGQRAALPPSLDAASAGFVLAPKLAPAAFLIGLDAGAALYTSGAAQALLLDRMNAPWKPRVAAGASVFSLLEEAFPRPGDADRVLTEFGWRALTEREKIAAESRRIAATVLAAPASVPDGPTLVIRVWDVKIQGLSTSGGAPRRIPEGTLYPSLRAAELTGVKDFRATYRDTSLIQRSGKKPRPVRNGSIFPTEFASFLGKDAVTLELDGKRLESVPSSAAFRRLSLRSARAELESSRPGRISSDADGITVELEAR